MNPRMDAPAKSMRPPRTSVSNIITAVKSELTANKVSSMPGTMEPANNEHHGQSQADTSESQL